MPGVAEVFHAHFVDHAYPVHTHEAWTLLIVDDGAIHYDLDRSHHGAIQSVVTLLPPHVPHDGRSASPYGFRKRVLYLDASVLGEELIGAAVDQPTLADPPLRHRLHQLHQALADPGDAFEAESRLAFVAERIREWLAGHEAIERHDGWHSQQTLADRLRQLLDAHSVDGMTLRDAAEALQTHPVHLARTFTRQYGLPPHRYLVGRRIDQARRLLLSGERPAEVAVAVGFYDQAHLTRQFNRYLDVGPARYATSRAR